MNDLENKYNFEILKEIGSGRFGSVYMVKNKKDNKIYALKKFLLREADKKNLDLIEKEAKILKTLNSENIVKYIDSFFYNNSFYLTMEFCKNSDSTAFINKHKMENKMISENVIWSVVRGLINGIKEIHGKKLIHRDLKPDNIFISDDYKVKIGDFGISKILNGTNYAQTFAGTLSYMAHEMFKRDRYNKVGRLGFRVYYL